MDAIMRAMICDRPFERGGPVKGTTRLRPHCRTQAGFNNNISCFNTSILAKQGGSKDGK